MSEWMKKDNYRELRVDCDCHTPTHFIKLQWIKWSDEPGDATIDVFFCSERIGGFWRRVGRALKYVFGTQDLITADIVISNDGAKELSSFLREVSE